MRLQYLLGAIGLLISVNTAALATQDEGAFDTTSAEVQRLENELISLAERQHWAGVERTYNRLLEASPDNISYDSHRSAADAARNSGDISATLIRLTHAITLYAADPSTDEMDRSLFQELESQFSDVEITTWPISTANLRYVGVMPFQPDKRLQIERAMAELAENGAFTGMLPNGDYMVDDREFTVVSGARVVIELADSSALQRRMNLDYRR